MRSLPLRGRGGVGLVDFALMLLRLTAVERGVPLCARRRGLLRLQWRRFWSRRARRVLCRCQKLRCFVCCPYPGPPPRGKGVEPREKRRRRLCRLRRFAQDVPLCARRRALSRLRWRRFWRRRAGVDAGRALCPRSFRPHPNPSPKGRGAVPRGKRQQLAFRLRYFAQDARLYVLPHGLLLLRWRRFWRHQAGVGAGQALSRWLLRCWRWNRERYPLPRPPPLRALTRPAGEGAVRRVFRQRLALLPWMHSLPLRGRGGVGLADFVAGYRCLATG